jgi:hypothetical protein
MADHGGKEKGLLGVNNDYLIKTYSGFEISGIITQYALSTIAHQTSCSLVVCYIVQIAEEQKLKICLV